MLFVEFLVEFVFQFLFEVLAEAAFWAPRKAWSQRGRLVLSALFGSAFGWGWTERLASNGYDGIPRTLWVSLVIAVGAALVAIALRQAAPEESYRSGLLPWRWSPHQWDALALLNVFVAGGVLAGLA